MKCVKKLRVFLLYSLLSVTFTACQIPAGSAAASTPMLTVRESTNCRTGPGEAYEIVFTYGSGTKLEIVGRYDPGNFWLVKSNESPSGTCWLWGEFVELTGDYENVPGVTPPSTATADTPDNGLSQTLFVEEWEYTCDRGTLTFTLRWNDQATDETGYRIFRNGGQLVELPADSTTYTDTVAVPTAETVEYYLQVFGPDGPANSSVMEAGC